MEFKALSGLLCALVSLAFGPDIRAVEIEKIAEAKGEVSKHPQKKSFDAVFDLGELPAGEKVNVRLKLSNPQKTDVTFKEVKMHCSCASFKSEKNTIKSGEATSFSLTLKTPKSNRKMKTPDVLTSISLLAADGSGLVLSINIKYKLKGMLSIARDLVVLEIPSNEKLGQLYIPYLISNPIKKSDLTMKASKELAEVAELKIAQHKGQEVIQVSVLSSELDKGSVSGEVWLIDKKTGVHDSVLCTLRQQDSVVISPSQIRFRQIAEDEEDRFKANVIIRVNRKENSKNSANKKDSSKETAKKVKKIRVNAKLLNSRMSVKTRHLSDTVCRVTLVSKKPVKINEQDDSKLVVSWKISIGSESFDLKSPCVFE